MIFEDSTIHAYQVVSCTDFVISLLISPIAFTSLVFGAYRGFKTKQLIQTLPLLAIQFNTTFIWSCMLIERVRYFVLEINGQQSGHGNTHSFGYYAKSTFLGTALYLEPLNLFLYTWRFLASLESEEENRHLKIAFQLVSLFFIIVLPALFIAIYAAFVILFSRAEFFLEEGQSAKAKEIYFKYLKISDTLGYLQLTCNLFACLVMVLVIRLVDKMTKAVGYGL